MPKSPFSFQVRVKKTTTLSWCSSDSIIAFGCRSTLSLFLPHANISADIRDIIKSLNAPKTMHKHFSKQYFFVYFKTLKLFFTVENRGRCTNKTPVGKYVQTKILSILTKKCQARHISSFFTAAFLFSFLAAWATYTYFRLSRLAYYLQTPTITLFLAQYVEAFPSINITHISIHVERDERV